MASLILFLIVFITFCTNVLSDDIVGVESDQIHPLTCSTSDPIQTCNSYLYHRYTGRQIEEIASLYFVNISKISPIFRGKSQNQKDYLVSVTCSCKDISGTSMYLYDTKYVLQKGEKFETVSGQFFSGQALNINVSTIHLVCGCVEKKSQVVVTYTVQEHDTLSGIEEHLSAYESEIVKLNKNFTENPSFVAVGWVLFVPSEKNGFRHNRGKKLKVAVVISVLAAISFVFMAAFITFIHMRNRICRNIGDDVHLVPSSKKAFSLNQQFFKRQMEETFENERPVVYTMEEIKKVTSDFDDTRKIGEGGYGCVYFAVLGEVEVAIKKMKSSRATEFFAELKVLCKIHHNNVVELLGYASGTDDLCLVYEFVQNGSLNDHLHDPLLKGHQPLSWTARAQIALDTARGIEYIHDHTKTRYVHRDIKTSNILLDQGLRAKVADFGLAKLVERSNEEDIVATRVVGTPGYIPPESVRELQMTSKSDVYAFGVVLGELITGQRAIVRDNREPKRMKSLASVIYAIFLEEDPEIALEAKLDGSLKEIYPVEEVYKMGEIARWCTSEDPVNRPEMRDIVQKLSKILISSIEWEASLGGRSEVFSGVFTGR